MVEAVRTSASTFGIWVIVAVAMIALAVWLVGIYVADGYQTRLSRQRRRVDAPGPTLSDAGVPASAIPSQRRDAGQPAPEPEPEPEPEAVAAPRGRHARPWAGHSATDHPDTARPRTDGLRTDFRTDGPLTDVETDLQKDAPARSDVPAQADAPTRPDLPAQPTQPAQSARPDLPAQPTPTGRHAMPTQRSGDSDRAERTYAGPDADREDDQDQR
jgi:hypothetical protein